MKETSNLSKVMTTAGIVLALGYACGKNLNIDITKIMGDDVVCSAESKHTPVDPCSPEEMLHAALQEENCSTEAVPVSCHEIPLEKILKPYARIDRENPQVKSSMRKFEQGFLEELERICDRNDINAMALLGVMHHETGGTFSPRIKNPNSGAVGLIQFTRTAAKQLGTTRYKLNKMSQLEQLRYVEKYFQQFKMDYTKPINIASAVFYPAAKGNPNYIIGKKNSASKSKRTVYRMNKGADTNNDGLIRMKEYFRRVLKSGYTAAPKKKTSYQRT